MDQGIGLGTVPDWLRRFIENGGIAGAMGMEPAIAPMVRQYQRTKERQAQGLPATGPTRPGDPGWEEMVDAAGNFDFTGPIGLGAPLIAGIFAGVKAKTANLGKLKAAEKMAAAGDDARKIWSETGWFKSPDGEWRFEIDDSGARITGTPPPPPSRYKLAEEYFEKHGVPGRKFATGQHPELDEAARAWAAEELPRRPVPTTPIEEVFGHSHLFDAYPGLRDLGAGRETSPEFHGMFDDKANRVTWGGGPVVYSASHSAGQHDRGTALHELQHAVQRAEGFARGSTPGEMAKEAERAQLARQALSWRRELAQLPRGMDLSAKENAVIEEYRKLGAMDFVPPREARDLAHQPYLTDADLERHAALLGDRVSVPPAELYRRTAGEAEARAVQKRMDMTPEQRRATFPLDSYDVPLDQLIVRRR